jgi:hypothetical protein
MNFLSNIYGKLYNKVHPKNTGLRRFHESKENRLLGHAVAQYYFPGWGPLINRGIMNHEDDWIQKRDGLRQRSPRSLNQSAALGMGAGYGLSQMNTPDNFRWFQNTPVNEDDETEEERRFRLQQLFQQQQQQQPQVQQVSQPTFTGNLTNLFGAGNRNL